MPVMVLFRNATSEGGLDALQLSHPLVISQQFDNVLANARNLSHGSDRR